MVVVVVVVTAGVIGAHGSQAWNSNLLPLHLDIHVRLRNLNELPGLGQEDGLQADHSAHGEKPSETKNYQRFQKHAMKDMSDTTMLYMMQKYQI